MTVHERLIALGIALPKPAKPVASYAPWVVDEGRIYVSGQLPFGVNGKLPCGMLGSTADLQEGILAARACAEMVIAQLSDALEGDLDRIFRIIRIGVFVSSTPSFVDQSKVANGASDLFQQAFPDLGPHARSAVGVSALPFGVPVEVDALVAFR